MFPAIQKRHSHQSNISIVIFKRASCRSSRIPYGSETSQI